METLENLPNRDPNRDTFEIRLSDILAFLKKSRQTILLCVVFGLFLALAYLAITPKEYESEAVVMPEIQSRNLSNLGGLSSLAGLAGLNLGSLENNEGINPQLYPMILNSVPFYIYLLDSSVFSTDKKASISLREYLTVNNKSYILDFLSKWFFNPQNASKLPDPYNYSKSIRLTQLDEEKIFFLQKRITTLHDKKLGLITMKVTMPDPILAAKVTRLTVDYMVDYVVDYQTSKYKKEVAFLTTQVKIARNRYTDVEQKLSQYKDQNQNLFLNAARVKEQSLQAEFVLAQDLYTSLSKQLETAKIKVETNTPVLKIFDPPRVPLKKSAPRTGVVCIVGVMLGFIFGVLASLVNVIVGMKKL